MILLDTQALVWFVQGDASLGPVAGRIVVAEADADGVLVSPISLWEIAMLSEKGRIGLGRGTLEWTEGVLERPGLRLEPISAAIAVDAGRLPPPVHGDPADRLIIATARQLACPILTSDRHILAYAAAGHVRAVDARR